MQERDFYLFFSLINGIGPKTFEQLLKHFKSAEKAWNSSSNDLKIAGFSIRIIRKIEEAKLSLKLKEYQEKLKHKKVSFLALCDKEYPKLLLQIPNPPIVLYYKGDLSSINFEKTVGIVGTRKITNYGGEVTKLFSFDLAQSGITIVSGLAMGVDAVAAWSAIEANGKTIAVLGNGVDLCFPSSNEKLYDKILEKNGIIISEFPLGMSPSVGSFPSRNRIIAGLSLGVLVTEGAEDSGSLITAEYAFKFQRPVFAIPGPITSQLSKAPLKLIGKGAKLVLSADDILKELKVQKSELQTKTQTSNSKDLSKDELKVLQILENESLSFDEIVRNLGLDTSKTASILSMMEIKSLIKNTGGQYSIS